MAPILLARASSTALLLNVLFFALLLSIQSVLVQGQKVAIIGAGIGGAAASYYLKDFAPQAQSTIFEERDYIGGRLKVHNMQGTVVEVGGDVWADVNLYMVEAASKLKIPLKEDDESGNGLVGVWDGHQFVDVERIISLNPLSVSRITQEIEEFSTHLLQNYAGRITPFDSLDEFLSYGDLTIYSAERTDEYLDARRIDKEFYEATILPLMRNIFNQGLEMNGFSCFVTLLSASQVYMVKGGNYQFPEAMIDYANATVKLKSKVSSVTRVSDKKFLVNYGAGESEMFDYVIIAAPFEYIDVAFFNITLPEVKPRPFVTWFVTHVVADSLSPAYFGNQLNPVPDFIFTEEEADLNTPWVSIKIVARTPSGVPIYKIFSSTNVENLLQDIFINHQEHTIEAWPQLKPISLSI